MTQSTEHIHCRAETEPPNAAATGVNGYNYNCSVQNECSAFGSHHIHTHIPAYCRCTGSSLAMRISGSASATNGHDDCTTFTSYPCLLPEAGQFIGNEDFWPCMHVARQLISKCRVQNECSAFCSHHIHTHTPACCRWLGSLSAMRMSGSASATNGHEVHHIHLISLPAASAAGASGWAVPMRICLRKYVKYLLVRTAAGQVLP